MTTSAARSLPVVLVHDRPGKAWVWTPLRAALDDAGFCSVVGLEDTYAEDGLCEAAAEVTSRALIAMAASGADGVHLVGHGLGGVLVTQLATRGPLAGLTATAVTIASPHRVSTTAHRSSPGLTRWVSYFTDQDREVAPTAARLSGRDPGVTNVLIPGRGHLTLCRDARLIRSLVRELTRSEGPAPAGALVGHATYAQAA